MPQEDKKKKIPGRIRREIRQRAKTESGRRGAEAKPETGAGRALRRTFGKGKYKLKRVGIGQKRGRRTPEQPEKPKMEKAGMRYRKFEGPKKKGQETKQVEKFDVDAKSKEALRRGVEAKEKEKGVKTPQVTPGLTAEEGQKAFKRNIAKKEAYKEEKEKIKTPAGARTEASKAKLAKLRKMRSKFIREAGGKIGKGERRMKRALKKRMKKDYREGKYQDY